jgi:hypothetical protein
MCRITEILKYNALAPTDSLLQEFRDPTRTTDRYVPIDHLGVIEALNRQAWFIADYQQVKPWKKARSPYVRWLASYHNLGFEPFGETAVPHILHQGSHDGSKQLILTLGFFNVEKQTMAVVGESAGLPLTYKHFGAVPENIDVVVSQLLLCMAATLPIVGRLQNYELSPPRVLKFLEDAVAFRFPKEKYHAEDLGVVLGLAKLNLWDLLLQLQKVLMSAENLNIVNKSKSLVRKAKPLTNIRDSVKLRTDLWGLALSELNKEDVCQHLQHQS